jgi:hypothetical protein
MMTSEQAQQYLVSFGLPVKSRASFYKFVEEHKIPYANLTPSSRKKTRRFRKEDLDAFLKRLGYDL